jgi:uncharacterized protein YrzB (UPF0473 family)
LVVLVDEEGREHRFTVLDLLTVNTQDYAIMIPVSGEESGDQELEEQEAVIFRLIPDGGEQALMVVEDDEEWQAVAMAWEEACAEVLDGDGDTGQ